MICFREISIDHYEELNRIQETRFKEHLSINQLTDILNNPSLYLTVGAYNDANQLLGYYCLLLTIGSADIVQIAVVEEVEHMGLGTLMMNDIIVRLKEKVSIAALYLEVRASNEKAIGLYEKFGMEHIGYRRQYYDDLEDALVYRLMLTEVK